MTQGLREIQAYDLGIELERVLLPKLTALLQSRSAGHCMRVTDLDQDLIARLCGRLRAEVADAEVVILGNASTTHIPDELTVSSTKLVELRNPLPEGTQRPPLLVFIPNNIRAAAEDSFGVATFEDVSLGDVYGELKASLLKQLPSDIRGAVIEALGRLTESDKPWTFADPVSVVRYLLTAKVNGNDPEALGAALYELALVPDFELLFQPEKAPSRVERNRHCVEQLTWSSKSERGRVLDLGLADQSQRVSLGNFVAAAGLEEPRFWTRNIVLNRNYWGLAFDKWVFEDGGEEPDAIFIGDVSTNLHEFSDKDSDERLNQLVGQRVLSLSKISKFTVTFSVDPLPSKVKGVAKFSVQVISREHGPVGLVRNKSAWSSKRSQAQVTFSMLKKIDWEKGWHFIRVVALDQEGDLIPLVDHKGDPLPWAEDEEDFEPRPNESDLFYVLTDEEIDVEMSQRAIQREASLVHARARLKFTALLDERDPDGTAVASVIWAERKPRGRAVEMEMLEVNFGRDGKVNVPVSRPLKALEHMILADAEGPVHWHISVTSTTSGQPTGAAARWPEGELTARFLAVRAAYFEALRSGTAELVTQGADLVALRPLIVDYANAYQELVLGLLHRAGSDPGATQQALSDLHKILTVDTVSLTIRDYRGRTREAALIAPTHPLRALWLAAWAELVEQWLAASKVAAKVFAIPTRDSLLRLLAPIGFPPVLPTSGGRRLLTVVDNLHPFWTLYAPSHEEDPRSLVGDVCAALGIPEPAIGGATIDGAYLASRIQRYLVQHPYIHTLVINAFNAGRAVVLADMLLHLQKERSFAGICYDIRLFVPDADAPDVGQALAELLSPTAGVTVREADAFATLAKSHLRPKLALAVRPTTEFRKAPERHAAHLSILFDLFPAEEVGAAQASLQESAAAIHGLVQDFQVDYREDETTVVWSRQPRHGLALPLSGAEELTDLLSVLPSLLSRATAAVSTGETGRDMRPVIKLALDTDDRTILHQVHEVSDWVFTLDRNMGIEFFDHGGLQGRPDYLIDHSPQSAGSPGHQLTITSRSVSELEAILRPVLDQFRLKAEGRHALAILDQLRSLSGRLALKLISSPNQRAEALGLALSRMYLEHQGVFTNQVVVPLDAHLELYRVLKQNADELGDEVSFKRTDLALFDLQAKARTITCRLVEVKCYNQVGDLGAFNALKARIAEQIAQSEEVLCSHFDPVRFPIDRPDRLVKTRELVTLLEFYLDRASRYGAVTKDAEEEARFLMRTMEDGYRLAFTRAAIIFDFDKPGTEPAEHENGIQFHRIGFDLIQELVDTMASEPIYSGIDLSETVEIDDKPVAARSMAALARRREMATSLPTLDDADFLGRSRDRSVSWEDLHTRRTLGEDVLHDFAEDTSESEPSPGEPTHELTPSEPEMVPASVPQPAEIHDSPSQPSEVPDLEVAKVVTLPEAEADRLHYDVLLGVNGPSPQYGILGQFSGRKVAIDLNQTHTISLFGVQGGGKSYTLGTVAEMASLSIPNINLLPQPLATVIFHYSPTMDYKPEFTSMALPNTDAAQLQNLREHYGAQPKALTDVLLLVSADKLETRRQEYPSIEVRPLKFASSELRVSDWSFLMGAVGNQATYISQLKRIIKGLRNNLTLSGVRQAVEDSQMADNIKARAFDRLEFAGDFIDDAVRLGDLIYPGRLIIVDLRDELIEKDQALGLFVVLLQLFADAKHEGRAFNKLVVFDEAHKYIGSPDLVAGLVAVVREMRHKGTSIMVASQDPPSVPLSLIELSSQIILHKFNSPAWLKHIQKANAALGGLTPEKMAHLRPGEAYIWSSKATDEAFCRGAIKVRCRPRVTQHGGATKTAVDG